MSSPADSSASRRKKRPGRSIAMAVLYALAGIALLWFFPGTRGAILSVLAPPREIPVPKLSAANAITPGTVGEIRMLEHWGNGNFGSMAWSPDGRTLVVTTTFGFDLYDARTAGRLQTNYIPFTQPYLPSFSPDGSLLALAGENGMIGLFDLQENRLIQQWEMSGRVSVLNFLQDGTLICVTEAGDVLRLGNGKWRLVTTLKDGFLTDVAFLPDRQALLAVYAESTQLIDPLTGHSQKLSFVAPYGGDLLLSENHRVEVDRDLSQVSSYTDDMLINQVTLADEELFHLSTLSPRGDRMATFNTDPSSPWGGTITFWQIPSLERIRSFTIPEANLNLNEIAFSPDGERLAVLDSPFLVKIYSVQEGGAAEVTLSDPFEGVGDLGISPLGKIWLVHCTGTSVEIIDKSSGAIVQQWKFNQPACGKLLGDGMSVAINILDGNTQMYRVGEESPIAMVSDPCCQVFAANGSAGMGSGEAYSSGDPIVIGIWQRRLGPYQKWIYRQEGYRGFHLAVSPSGQYGAASSPNKTHFYVHGIESGRTYPSLFYNGRIAFSPDETLLASASQILDLKTGKLIRTEGISNLSCSPESFSIPAFSPDGQIVAVAACGQIFFWRVNDGSLLAELTDPYYSYELQFSPDGAFLLGEGIGNASVWALPKAGS